MRKLVSSAREPSRDGLWPNPTHLSLIKAALWQGEGALAAWSEWRSAVDLSQPLDPITLCLLPLLYWNMHAHGEAGGEMLRLKGLYRHAWYTNNQLLHDLYPLLRDLHRAGFRLLFLKGVPLAQLYYQRLGARPMNDIDFLVPLDQVEDVLAFMDARGHVRDWPQPHGGTEYRHAMPYRVGSYEIDIHRHLLRDCADPRLTERIWAEAESFSLDGLGVLAPAPTDMLFHQIMHGLRWNEVPSLRWIPDAWTIIQRRARDIDWRRLTQLCKEFAFCRRARLALEFLREELRADVPRWVLESLSAEGPSLVEWMEATYILHDHSLMYRHPAGKLWITFCDYQSCGRRRRHVPRVLGFSHFVRDRWGAAGRLELAKSVVTGSLRRLLDRPSG
jgi:hypothetical protein